VECSAVPGSGRLELTGNLGEVMKESCHAAVSYIRSRTASLGIDPEFYKNTDIHLHFPEGAVPKDGPSAGAAICLCVVSALTNRPVRCDVAMTGEITLRGRVLPIGGIQEKSMGALRSGIHEILLPEGNVSDLEEVDENVRNAVTYRAVSHMDQVLEIALCPLPENAEYSGEEISMVMPEQRGREGTRVGV
jgi:ATP-dependent Lon protease